MTKETVLILWRFMKAAKRHLDALDDSGLSKDSSGNDLPTVKDLRESFHAAQRIMTEKVDETDYKKWGL